jgi:site-specific DNA recombinase
MTTQMPTQPDRAQDQLGDALYERTVAEIGEIAAEFHARLDRESAQGVGAIYARYSTRYQQSIGDQVRTLFEEAKREQLYIPLENVFFDTATKGYSSRRPGLIKLRNALDRKQLDVLLVFATNRLFRKTYKSLQFVEEELVERGVRCIFVKSNIDTADEKRWRFVLQIYSAMDENAVSMYSDHVRAAHEGLFLRGMVTSSLPVGYTGEAVQGEQTKRKLPRRRIIVDPDQANYVRQVFSWFTEQYLTMQAIAQRLNADPEAPVPPKSPMGTWCQRSVRYLLANASYRGEWSYGRTETKWQSKKDYARQVERAEPLKTVQFENLRIVSDEVWCAAQTRLAANKSAVGRRSRDADVKSRPRVLNGLLRCPTHDRPMYVGGGYGRNMYCKDCRSLPPSDRPLFTELNRELAVKLTCAKIAELISADNDLVEGAIHSCQAIVESGQQIDPAELKRQRAKEDRLKRRISFAVQNLGDSAEEEQLATELLADLRRQRTMVVTEIKRLEAAAATEVTIPSESDVRSTLKELSQILIKSASGATDEGAPLVRRIINLVTGGRIDLYQQGERLKKRGWLQGRFQVKLLTLVLKHCPSRNPEPHEDAMEVTIDYQQPVPFAADADQVWALYKDGKHQRDIADLLGCSRSRITKLLKYAAKQHGETLEDGRKRRHRLTPRKETLPDYQRIADDVMELCDQGLLLQDVAERLKFDRNTVTKAIAFWHASRGLAVPDGRTRRKRLKRQQPTDRGD